MPESDRKKRTEPHLDAPKHFPRPRINSLLSQAIQKPLVIVCAVAGYGKTRAVSDFVRESDIPATWVQCTESDNISTRFWESFVHSFSSISEPLVEELKEIGFPDTADKMERYFSARDRYMKNPSLRYLYIVDDAQLLRNPAVIRFVEQIIHDCPESRTVILICRNLPEINIINMQAEWLVQNINEADLAFNETELAEYFTWQGLSVNTQTLNHIYQDTNGWAFSINLVARSLKKSASYMGYISNAVKHNIFTLMESEIWRAVSERLKHFLLCLSLIEHLPTELVTDLAGGDDELIAELEQRSAYVRFDSDSGAYFIHHLFKDFLSGKKELLTDHEKNRTYQAAAKWCAQNDYVIDALNYYEKVGDYEAITSISFEASTQSLVGIVHHVKGIFDRAPKETFDQVELLAAAQIRILMCMGLYREAVEMMTGYEQKFLALPEDDPFRNRTMGAIYYLWGLTRMVMSTKDDRYDFDLYFEKMHQCLTKFPLNLTQNNHPVGPWISLVGSGRHGALKENIETLTRSVSYIRQAQHDWAAGEDDLARGELLFYQGDIVAAESFVIKALDYARSRSQFMVAHRALFYTMRIGVLQGSYEKVERAIKEMEARLTHKEYADRFFTYDISLGWYYYLLRMPEKTPSWLKGNFTPCYHPIFLDNFANQMKLRYHYQIKNYPLLLAYIGEQEQQMQALFGRIEQQAIKACTLYYMRDKAGAFATLRTAYEMALPNEIIMPFIELGKDIRTLTIAALREKSHGLPETWLKTINLKSTYYSKYQALIIGEHNKEYNADHGKPLSPREAEVLRDLCNGLSRPEMAAKYKLSISTVKMNINHIAEKLKAQNTADIIRIATEQKLV